MRMADCHPDRKHYAKGLCSSCYLKTPRQIAYRIKYVDNNKEKIKQRGIAYENNYKNRRIELNSLSKNRQKKNLKGKERYIQNRIKILNAYGNICVCCGENREVFLQIDHINNDGAKHRREIGGSNVFYRKMEIMGYPPILQILCANCHLAKTKNVICPHKEVLQ